MKKVRVCEQVALLGSKLLADVHMEPSCTTSILKGASQIPCCAALVNYSDVLLIPPIKCLFLKFFMYIQVRRLISVINEATSAIPGWDDYARSGIARQLWDGNIR